MDSVRELNKKFNEMMNTVSDEFYKELREKIGSNILEGKVELIIPLVPRTIKDYWYHFRSSKFIESIAKLGYTVETDWRAEDSRGEETKIFVIICKWELSSNED